MLLQLLHAPSLHVADSAVLPLSPNDAALLAVLAVDGPTPREAMADLLWPDAAGDSARGNLRQRLSRFKSRAGLVLDVGGQRLALPPAPGLTHDLLALEQRLEQDPAAAAGQLLGALAFDTNPRLAQWLQRAREQWRTTRNDTLATLAERFEQAGQIARALPFALRLTQDDPLAEHAHRRLMRLHHLRGDRSAALASYETLAQGLHAEFGEAPGLETRQMVSAIAQGVGAPAPRAQPVPAALRRPPVMVGRNAAWQALESALSGGRAVLLVAEPGMGKSRLLQEVSARQDALCLQTGRPGDHLAPYALAGRLLAALEQRWGAPAIDAAAASLLAWLLPAGWPVVGAGTPGTVGMAPLRQAFERALVAWQRAGLAGVVIDDLHHADAASLELLLPLTATPALVGTERLRWLLAVRPHQMPASLGELMAARVGERLLALHLEPLGAKDVAALLVSLALPGLEPAAWAPRLLAHVGGNPLLLLATLTELHTHLQGRFASPPPGIPMLRSLAEGLRERLRALSPTAQQLAQVAALAQQDFSVELAAAVMQCSVPMLVAPWRELQDAHVFNADGFSHDLVCHAVVNDVPAPVARALCRQVAQWLAHTGAPPARIADHWWQCEAWALAADAFERAATAAARVSRQIEEREMLERAAVAHERAGADRLAFDCRWRLAHLLLNLGAATEALAMADALLSSGVRPEDRQRALEARAAVHNEMTDAPRALADVAAALACDPTTSRRATTVLMQVRLARREAFALMRLNRSAEALGALQSVGALVSAVEDIDERLAWRVDVATALNYDNRLTDAVAVFQEIADEAETAGRWNQACEARGNCAVTLTQLSRPFDAVQHSERTIELGQRYRGGGASTLIDEMTLAGVLCDLGRFDAALSLGIRVAEQLRSSGHAAWCCNAENDLCNTYLWLGRADLAQQVLQPVPDHAPDWARGARLLTQLRLDAFHGRPADGRLAEAARLLAPFGQPYVRFKLRLEQARYAGHAEMAAAGAQVEIEAFACQQFAVVGQALTLQIQALRGLGQTVFAAAAAMRLLDHLKDRQPVAIYPAEPWWRCALALGDAGEHTRSAFARDRALEWLETQALPHVPALYRDSFLQRNPVNRELLAATRRT